MTHGWCWIRVRVLKSSLSLEAEALYKEAQNPQKETGKEKSYTMNPVVPVRPMEGPHAENLAKLLKRDKREKETAKRRQDERNNDERNNTSSYWNNTNKGNSNSEKEKPPPPPAEERTARGTAREAAAVPPVGQTRHDNRNRNNTQKTSGFLVWTDWRFYRSIVALHVWRMPRSLKNNVHERERENPRENPNTREQASRERHSPYHRRNDDRRRDRRYEGGSERNDRNDRGRYGRHYDRRSRERRR